MRITLFMTNGLATISEVHWTFIADYPAAVQLGLNLAAKRALLLGEDASMMLVRVSLDSVFRDSQVGDTSTSLPAPGNGPCDPRFRDVVIRMEGGSARRRTLYLGLIPDGVVVAGQYTPGAVGNWQPAMQNYLNFLTGQKPFQQQLGFVSLIQDPAVCPRVQIISSAQPNLGTLPTFVTTAPHKLTVNGVVRIGGCAFKQGSFPAANGLYTVTQVPTPTTFTIFTKKFIGNQLFTRGKAQRMLHDLFAYTKAYDEKISYRRRGVRLFQRPGKSSIRA